MRCGFSDVHSWLSPTRCPANERMARLKRSQRFVNLISRGPYPKVVWLDNQALVSTRDYPGLELWDVAQKCPRETLLKDKNIYTYTVLPCGKILGTRLHNETKVWDASNPDEPVAEFTAPKEPSEWVRHEVFAPTGDRIAAGSREGTVYVWNFQNPEEPTLLTGHTDYVTSLAFSPDGKRLVSGASDDTTRLWDVALGEQIATLPLDEPRCTEGIAFSPCGKIIAGGMDNEIRLWCAEELTTLRTIPQSENSQRTYALAFSSCGKYLVSGTWWQRGMKKMAIRCGKLPQARIFIPFGDIQRTCSHLTSLRTTRSWRVGRMMAQFCCGM